MSESWDWPLRRACLQIGRSAWETVYNAFMQTWHFAVIIKLQTEYFVRSSEKLYDQLSYGVLNFGILKIMASHICQKLLRSYPFRRKSFWDTLYEKCDRRQTNQNNFFLKSNFVDSIIIYLYIDIGIKINRQMSKTLIDSRR